ncbi:peptidase domain-containing ABC transporter [Runella sp. MFBS21]|uniref:peptidase domain-containing ABC transporter n=1 Tax=Runella sp. MFBS21 TaxID=3034018 RepID=UPI0023F88109|nr:peptidase domain-containing ABC transporter [Runella sp. MFBS21]MDF7816132.1 peptidase domain-containing ABC transporter [Runella sp. MFBS21]
MKKNNLPFIRQQDQSDCGVACLASVVRYFGGEVSLERLRALSGTTNQGTTLLGLCQAAQQIGLEAEGFEAESIEMLYELPEPVILHVVIDGKLEHYVVCSSPPSEEGIKKRVFTITDPAKGIVEMTQSELDAIWKSKILLQLTPTERFQRNALNSSQKLRWLRSLIQEDLSVLIIAAVLGVVISMMGLGMSLFSQKLIDEILPKQNTQKLTIGLILLGMFLVARLGISYLRALFLLRQAQSFNNRVAGSFYERLIRLPKSFFDSRKTGDLIARMHDTRRIQSVIASLAGNVLIDFLVVIISAVFVFIYSVEVGIIILLSLPFFGWLVWKYHLRIMHGQRAVMAGYARVESEYVDTITGIGAIKAAGREDFFTRTTQSTYEGFQQKSYEVGLLGTRYGIWAEVFGVVITVAMLAVASVLVLQKQLKIGEMMAVISVASGMIGAVGRLATLNIQIQEARIAFERMYEFTSLESEMTASVKSDYKSELDNLPITTPDNQKEFIFLSLIIKNLSFRFVGRSALLKNISLELHKGEMIALLGESGHGKSTLMQILQKFYDWEEGKVCINGQDLRMIDTRLWRQNIGVVPQEIKIFNGTVLENIVLGEVVEPKEVIQFCQDLQISYFFEQLPQSYMTLVGEEGINLSGGQKQLVALARALWQKPQLLLLDEATASMDKNTERVILQLLQRLKSKITIFLITHKMQTAYQANRIYIIENGRCDKYTTPEQLLRSPSLYSEG